MNYNHPDCVLILGAASSTLLTSLFKHSQAAIKSVICISPFADDIKSQFAIKDFTAISAVPALDDSHQEIAFYNMPGLLSSLSPNGELYALLPGLKKR